MGMRRILRGGTDPRGTRTRLASLALVLVATTACHSLPQADRGGGLHWPAGWIQRDRFVHGDLHLLAASQQDANEALDLYQAMLGDLESVELAPPPGGLVLVIGADEEATLDDLDRILGQLAHDKIGAFLERDRARRAGSSPDDGEDDDDALPEAFLAMAALPLDVDKVLTFLEWRPEPRPHWAITLPTRAATRRALDDEIEKQGGGFVLRAAFALMRSQVMATLRKALLTRMLVEVAYPDLSKDEKAAIRRSLDEDLEDEDDPEDERPPASAEDAGPAPAPSE